MVNQLDAAASSWLQQADRHVVRTLGPARLQASCFSITELPLLDLDGVGARQTRAAAYRCGWESVPILAFGKRLTGAITRGDLVLSLQRCYLAQREAHDATDAGPSAQLLRLGLRAGHSAG